MRTLPGRGVELLAAVALAGFLALTAGCGAGERPTEKQLSAVFQKGVKSSSGGTYTLTAKQADCAAKVFSDSSLSDEALRAITERDDGYKAEGQDEKVLDKLEPALRKCGTG